MDPISYGVAAKQKQRIEKVIAEPDSTSGVITVPQVIATGETITVPAGRTAVLPNVQVDGELVVDGEVFIPSGSSYTATEVDATVVKQNGNVVANDSTVVHKTGDETIAGVKTFTSSPIVPTPTSGTQAVNKDYADLKVALASFVGTNQSLSVNGYQKLPGGLIIQWCHAVATASGTEVTLPIAFPNVFLLNYVTCNNGSAVGGVSSIQVGLTMVKAHSDSGPTGVSILAIGY